MEGTKAYRALSYELRLFGYWPEDLAAAFLLFIVVHLAFERMLLNLAAAGPVLWLAHKTRNRAPLFFFSLYWFCRGRPRYAVATRPEVSLYPNK